MIWFFFFFNLVLLLTFYIILNRKIDYKLKIKNSAIPDKIKREVNSIIVEFNKTANDNINLLENKIDELKHLLKISQKFEERSKNKKSQEIFSEDRKLSKYELIDSYLKKKMKPLEIARLLGISQTEVDLYIKMRKERRKKNR